MASNIKAARASLCGAITLRVSGYFCDETQWGLALLCNFHFIFCLLLTIVFLAEHWIAPRANSCSAIAPGFGHRINIIKAVGLVALFICLSLFVLVSDLLFFWQFIGSRRTQPLSAPSPCSLAAASSTSTWLSRCFLRLDQHPPHLCGGHSLNLCNGSSAGPQGASEII